MKTMGHTVANVSKMLIIAAAVMTVNASADMLMIKMRVCAVSAI